MVLEPPRRMINHNVERSSFGKEMTGARNDCQRARRMSVNNRLRIA
jgi:hypothetical protein